MPPGFHLASSGLADSERGAGIHAWALGAVAPGEARVLSVPIEVPGNSGRYSLPGSALERIDAWVTDATGAEQHAGAAMWIGADSALALAIDSDRDPATSTDDLGYTLTYGNAGAAPLEAASLRFPLPEAAVFISATGGGTRIGDEVVWDLGVVPVGGGGARSVTLSVDPGLPDGTLLHVAGAVIEGVSDGVPRIADASTITPLRSTPPLRLVLEGPALARPGERVAFRLTVTNTSLQRQDDAQIQLFFPGGFEAYDGSTLLGQAGGCVSGVIGGGFDCFPGDGFRWTIGALEPGTGKTVLFEPRVQRHGVTDGRLLRLSAVATEGNAFFPQPAPGVGAEARASLTLLLHPDRDSDADGDADGVGDACSTLDIDGDGSENALSDGILIIRGLLGFSGPALVEGIGPFGADPDPVDAAARIEVMRAALDIDGDGRSDALSDGILLIRYLFGFEGAALVEGALSLGATRTTPEAIAAYIAGIL